MEVGLLNLSGTTDSAGNNLSFIHPSIEYVQQAGIKFYHKQAERIQQGVSDYDEGHYFVDESLSTVKSSFKNTGLSSVYHKKFDSAEANGLLSLDLLTHIQEEFYKESYPDLNIFKVFPKNKLFSKLNPWREQYAYKKIAELGKVEVYQNGSTVNPLSDVEVQRATGRLLGLAGGISYSYEDMEQAKLGEIHINDVKVSAMRKAFKEKMNQIGWFGYSTPAGQRIVHGLLSLESANTMQALASGTVPSGTVSEDEDFQARCFQNKTALQIVADFQYWINTINDIANDITSKEVRRILIAKKVYRWMKWTRISSLDGQSGIHPQDPFLLNFLKEKLADSDVELVPCWELNKADTDGNTPQPMMVFCTSEFPELVAPHLEPILLPAQHVGMDTRFYSILRYGGVKHLFNDALYYVTDFYDNEIS